MGLLPEGVINEAHTDLASLSACCTSHRGARIEPPPKTGDVPGTRKVDSRAHRQCPRMCILNVPNMKNKGVNRQENAFFSVITDFISLQIKIPKKRYLGVSAFYFPTFIQRIPS